MAHALDPEYISAWVGQAYVASLWGTTDAGAVFQHAFESSNGTAVSEAISGLYSIQMLIFVLY